MTMTTADVGADDGGMAPRADQPKRRRFSAEFKAAILAEYDAAADVYRPLATTPD